MDLIYNTSEISLDTELPTWEGPGIRNLVLAGPSLFSRPRPLLLLAGGPEWDWLHAFHKKSESPLPTSINAYFIQNLTIVGHDACILNNKLLVGPDMLPAYRARQYSGPHGSLLQKKLHLPCKYIDEPCFPLAADGKVYGHFLIETLVRLHVVRKFLHPLLPDYKVLVVKNLPVWTRNILADVYGLQENDLLEYDPDKEKVQIRKAIWPSLTMKDNHFHEYTNNVILDILSDPAFCGGLNIHRLMISRAWFKNPIMKHADFSNEYELTEIAAREFGFCPISPETLSWVDQVRLFANAKLVVGRFGSGLHNSLFCRRGTRVGVMGFRNLVQSSISALRSHDMAYITDGNDEIPFYVSPDQFRRMLDILIKI